MRNSRCGERLMTAEWRAATAAARLPSTASCHALQRVALVPAAGGSGGQLPILAPLDAERPLEEGTRRTAFAADVERISQQDVLPRPRNERTRPVVVLRDREDAAPVERR